MKRKLGLDVGDRTIGVAVSDALGITAQGLTTIRRENNKEDFAILIEMLNTWDVGTIVVGLPKNMNNTEGPQAEKVRLFIKQLSKKIKYSDKVNDNQVTIEFWDERLSTMLVERTLIEADVSRKKRKTVIDKLAAVNILQGYLDLQKNKRSESDGNE